MALRKITGPAAVLILAAGSWFWLFGEPVEVTIPPGLSAQETAVLLRQRGVICSTVLFRGAAKLAGTDRRLMPGTYQLRRHMPMIPLLNRLASGTNLGVKILIPEGFSSRQIAERLEAASVCRSRAFLDYVAKRGWEGYLFPTTYYFASFSNPQKVAERMRQEFERRIEAEYSSASPRPRLTLHQVVTLASILEREAVDPQEKPMIAAVYLNRMRRRMRLEADPTVQYTLGHWKKGLTSRDLRVISAYNTYIHYGLPPGPICSPGLDSFKAALRPAQIDAIYFVADNKGGHVFSETHEEHLQAKRSFKRGLRAIKARLRQEESERRRAH